MISAPFEGTRPIPEDQLVARCRAGDLEVFDQLYVRYERLVFRCAYHMLGHREDARDICQETFLNAYRALARFRGECSLQTWLLRICTNLCRNHLMSRSRHAVASDLAMAEAYLTGDRDALDPQLAVERSHTTAIVRRALHSLPPAQRELIILREYEGLSCEEIAQIFHCAPATVRGKLFRARRRLKERVESLLGAWGGEDVR